MCDFSSLEKDICSNDDLKKKFVVLFEFLFDYDQLPQETQNEIYPIIKKYGREKSKKDNKKYYDSYKQRQNPDLRVSDIVPGLDDVDEFKRMLEECPHFKNKITNYGTNKLLNVVSQKSDVVEWLKSRFSTRVGAMQPYSHDAQLDDNKVVNEQTPYFD